MAVAQTSLDPEYAHGRGAPPAVEVAGLEFTYGRDGHRLVDLSFSVREGEMCCLLGPNGAGKTTLLRCLLGLLKPASGIIRVLGQDVSELSARQIARMLAYVPQSSTVPFPFTAREMVVMGRTPHIGVTASPSATDRRAAFAQLDALGIGHLAHRSFSSLSGGEKQLTLLARALMQEAPALVLDEPTASLDYGNEIRFLDVMVDLVNGGRSVLMTTHQPSHALTHADRAILMQDGVIIGDGLPDQVVTTDRLSDLYGVPIQVATVPLLDGHGRTLRTCFPIPSSPTKTLRSER